MKYKQNTVRRPLSPESSRQFMQLQAQVSRIVGTHPGSAIRLFPISDMGVNIAPRTSLDHALRAAKMSSRLLSTMITDDLPQSAYEPLESGIKEVAVSQPLKGSILYVALGSLTLQEETRRVDESIWELTGENAHLNRFSHAIAVAHIDEDHVGQVLDFTESFFDLQGQPKRIHLEPVQVLGNPLTTGNGLAQVS